MLNARKRHPHMSDRQLIDWDMILIMEPLTIFGAVLGSLLGKVLPNLVLTASLVIILAFMGHKTLKKGISMWNEESKSVVLHSSLGDIDDMEMLGPDGGGITANIS